LFLPDSETQAAIQEIAELIAAAYLRFSEIRTVGSDTSVLRVNKELADPAIPSVHEL
jgi:hypothetical protein